MDNAKVAAALKHTAAAFVNRESNRRSLITVTRVELDVRGRVATIFVSIYPEEQARAALDFLNRSREDFSAFVREQISMRALPRFLFLQDPHLAGVVEENTSQSLE